MLADIAQTFGVILMVAAAAGYLGVLLRRSWRQRGGGCCGSGGCGASSQRTAEPDKAASGSQPFIPLENLADVARRHRKVREEHPSPPNT